MRCALIATLVAAILVVCLLFVSETIYFTDRIMKFLTFQQGFWTILGRISFLFFYANEIHSNYICTALFLMLEGLISYHLLVLVFYDLFKYCMNKRDGKDRMSDLVRATITVDKNRPWLAYDIMTYISQ